MSLRKNIETLGRGDFKVLSNDAVVSSL